MKLVKEFTRVGKITGKALYAIRKQGTAEYLMENGSFYERPDDWSEQEFYSNVREYYHDNIAKQIEYWQSTSN